MFFWIVIELALTIGAVQLILKKGGLQDGPEIGDTNYKSLGENNMLKQFYVTHPEDKATRYYTDDIKQANEIAQRLANEFKRTVVRYDIHGGQSWFRAEMK